MKGGRKAEGRRKEEGGRKKGEGRREEDGGVLGQVENMYLVSLYYSFCEVYFLGVTVNINLVYSNTKIK